MWPTSAAPNCGSVPHRQKWLTLFPPPIVAFTPSPAIPTHDHRSITNVLGIYYIAQDLYPKTNLRGRPKKSEVLRTRPADCLLEKIYTMNSDYWKLLGEIIPECSQAFNEGGDLPGRFRSRKSNHLLFRPVGQRAFASAVELLMSRKGKSMKASVELLSKADLWLNHEIWHYILWNPLQDQMITTNRIAAETFLLSQIRERGRSLTNDKRLKELLEKRDRQT
jgi:DNA sulfur modification protein DndB